MSKLCSCMTNPFAELPPEMRSPPGKKSSLRQVVCPICGLEYWTNRRTEVCFDCEKRGILGPETRERKGMEG